MNTESIVLHATASPDGAGCPVFAPLTPEAPPQPDKAIAEAFAQQAYTAIGNRDREIMRDPYMLGFEIVSKNEENTRLVGVFAFRVSGEILLAPVFYLNGQIKGQDLLYRKGVNRFVPNTDKWVSYLKSRGEDEEGRPVDRKALDARIHLDLRQMAGSRIKSAGHGEDCCDACKKGEKCTCRQPSADFDPDTKVITVLPDDATAEEKKQWEERGFIRREVKMASIRGLWKEAMDAWTAEEPGLLFAQVLLEQSLQKQAAELASRLPEFAELLYLAGSLEKSAQAAEGTAAEGAANAELKAVDAHQITVPAAQDFTEEINVEAAKTAGVNDLTLFLEPQPGWSEQEVEDFYKRGFALRDPREMKYLADAYVESDMSKSLSTLREPGLQTAQDVNGNKARVLWAPIFDPGEHLYPVAGNPAVGSAYRNDRTLGSDYGLLFLDGPDSGSFLRFNSSTPETNIPVFQDGDTFEADSENMSDSVNAGVKGVEPAAGKTYAIWLPGMRKMLCPTTIRSIKKSDGITKIHCCSPYSSNPIVINENLEVSDPAAMLTQGCSAPLILGTDAVFVPVEGC